MKNNILRSFLGYNSYFLLKTVWNRILYKKSVIALAVDGGNFKLPLGEGKKITVWAISNLCDSFPYARDDFEIVVNDRNILYSSTCIVQGKNIGKTFFTVRSLLKPSLETTCEVEVI
jgi:hypothetical protein